MPSYIHNLTPRGVDKPTLVKLQTDLVGKLVKFYAWDEVIGIVTSIETHDDYNRRRGQGEPPRAEEKHRVVICVTLANGGGYAKFLDRLDIVIFPTRTPGGA